MRPKVPSGLAERVEQYVDQGIYSSNTEFVNDAIRRRLEEIEEDQ